MRKLLINRWSLVFSMSILLLFSSCDFDKNDQIPNLTNESPIFAKPDLKVPGDYIPDNLNARENWTAGEGWAKGYSIPLVFEDNGFFDPGTELYSYKATLKAGTLEGTFEVENFDAAGELLTSLKGEVTCMVFEEDCKTVRMTGIITESSFENFVGRYAIWIAVDNGQGQAETTDIRYAVSLRSATYHCETGFTPEDFGPGAFQITDGNVKVKSMDCFGNVTGLND